MSALRRLSFSGLFEAMCEKSLKMYWQVSSPGTKKGGMKMTNFRSQLQLRSNIKAAIKTTKKQNQAEARNCGKHITSGFAAGGTPHKLSKPGGHLPGRMATHSNKAEHIRLGPASEQVEALHDCKQKASSRRSSTPPPKPANRTCC